MCASRLIAALVGVMLFAPMASAQGFAAMGTDAEGFALPSRDTVLRFPRDHGAHPDFRIEWWYLTANLTGPDGRDYGIQWTLFRSALRPGDVPAAEGWRSPQVWMAHAALTTPDRHLHAERFARGGIGAAGVTALPFAAWIDDWRMESRAAPEADPLDALDLSARGDAFRYDLRLEAEGPLALHGEDGFSVKTHDGRASHYYSQPHYRVSGIVETETGPVEVSGIGWLDREWSSQPLAETQSGWDWLALSFESGEKLAVARVRDGDDEFRAGTWIDIGGATTALEGDEITLTPLARQWVEAADAELPLRWRIEVPGHGVDIEARALNPDAWMGTSTPYWEGPVIVTGSHDGRGYLEMTGHGPPARN